MKRYNIFYLFILALFYNNPILGAEQLITLFLKPYPVVSIPEASKKLVNKLHRPGKIARNQSKNYLAPSVSGIFATYGGFLTISDLQGEISFPRKHSKPFIYLVISERITPIIMSGNTIHHWELQEGVPSAMYKMEQKVDPDTKINFWEITQEPAPINNQLPLESITLIADPKYIYIPLGITTFKPVPFLLLPDIYIKKGINLTENALYILNLTHYFGALIPIYKKDKDRYSRYLTY